MKPKQFLPLNGTDHIEFYVGNAKQSAYYYQTAWGFKLIAYAGLETGLRDKASYVLQQGKIILVLSTSLVADSEIAKHVNKHGDGVKVLALTVDDATKSYEETLLRGAWAEIEPKKLSDDFGEVIISAIRTYGDVIHVFVERKNYSGIFMPGYKAVNSSLDTTPLGLELVDHCVGNVELGDMNKWVKFYEDAMGFNLIFTADDQDISTEYSALMSKVVSSGNGFIKFPINEPAESMKKKKSQIQEYLDFYGGPGVQHIALATKNIVGTVKKLQARGVEFLYVPETYYEDVLQRVPFNIKEDFEEIKNLNILIDSDDEGYMLQLFTKPVEDRPTLFFEIIQRQGAKSFGKGNFKALFEAIEREQEQRGNL
jgi:4-hydroxyphenylpyruvate dioxygenase